MGEFNGGCAAADGLSRQPLLAAVLQEANARASAAPVLEPRLHAVVRRRLATDLQPKLLLHQCLDYRLQYRCNVGLRELG